MIKNNGFRVLLFAVLSTAGNLAFGQMAPIYSNASVKGTYAAIAYNFSPGKGQPILQGPLPAQLPAPLGFTSTSATIVFDGVGNVTLSLLHNTDGTLTTESFNGPYSVAADGTFTAPIGDGLTGTVVENGAIVLLNQQIAGKNPTIIVAARQQDPNDNTSQGADALASDTTGIENTASGAYSMYKNSTGNFNAAAGYQALFANTTGSNNTSFGIQTLMANTSGGGNAAQGDYALLHNTTGSRNAAVGNYAMQRNTMGSYNTAAGWNAGQNLTTGNDNVDIANFGVAAESQTMRLGRQGSAGVISSGVTRTFIAGISGVTTGMAGSAVVIDANGQLGTVSSSRRYKQDIQPMANASERLLKLRPVEFRYKQPNSQGERPIQYGLIAEEVAEVFPELVVRDKAGQPETVAYHLLPALMLNELQKEHRLNRERSEQVAMLQHQLEAQTSQLAEVKKLVVALQVQVTASQVAMR